MGVDVDIEIEVGESVIGCKILNNIFDACTDPERGRTYCAVVA